MKIRYLSVLVALSVATASCGLKIPVLSPTAASGLSGVLSALSVLLDKNGVATDAIQIAQTAIADDTSGASTGQIVRDLLNQLYQDVPGSVQNNTIVWDAFTAVEAILGTIKA